jgi:hypothetical protein
VAPFHHPGSGGKTLAAFGTAPLEHGSAALGRHAGPEPVPTLPPADIRLKGSLHSSSGKTKAASATGLESIEEAIGTEQQELFSAQEIHSPKAASGAASNDLSTAVETGVETVKVPAQSAGFVV